MRRLYVFKFWQSRQSIQKTEYWVVILLCMYVAIFFIWHIIQFPFFYASKVRILSNQLPIPPTVLSYDITQKPLTFFDNLDEWIKHFEHLSSIKSITYERHFPTHISIILERHENFAQWGEAKNTFVSIDGFIYEDKPIKKPSFQLFGPDEKAKDIIDFYQISKIWFAPFYIKKLTWMPQDYWKIELSNGIKIKLPNKNHDQLKQAINFWQKTYREWQNTENSNYAQVNNFDLRYTQGFSFKKINE